MTFYVVGLSTMVKRAWAVVGLVLLSACATKDAPRITREPRTATTERATLEGVEPRGKSSALEDEIDREPAELGCTVCMFHPRTGLFQVEREKCCPTVFAMGEGAARWCAGPPLAEPCELAKRVCWGGELGEKVQCINVPSSR